MSSLTLVHLSIWEESVLLCCQAHSALQHAVGAMCLRIMTILLALQALMFVRDLDTSLLGQNANGLEQFETLRQCTDELVNAILHVRQLLKRRRFEGMLCEARLH